MSVASVRRFAEALKTDPGAHRVGCTAWERKTGATLGLGPQELLDLCDTVDAARRTVAKLNKNRRDASNALQKIPTPTGLEKSFAGKMILKAIDLLNHKINGPWVDASEGEEN